MQRPWREVNFLPQWHPLFCHMNHWRWVLVLCLMLLTLEKQQRLIETTKIIKIRKEEQKRKQRNKSVHDKFSKIRSIDDRKVNIHHHDDITRNGAHNVEFKNNIEVTKWDGARLLQSLLEEYIIYSCTCTWIGDLYKEAPWIYIQAK